MRIAMLSGALAIAAISCAASADEVVVPNANTNARGVTGLNSLTRGEARTYQIQMSAAQVQATGLAPGMFITGLSWRMQSSTNNFPFFATADWTDYEITCAQATNAMAAMGLNFAANMTNPVLVRDGPLTIPNGSFPFNPALPAPTPQGWGPEIPFQNNYTYQGGDLVILFSHLGHNLAVDPFMDSNHFANPNARAISADGFHAAASPAFTNFVIQRLSYEVPSAAGACCCGASCSVVAPASCNSAISTFVPGGVCTPYSTTVPCCRGNFNKSVAGPGAPGGISVQDIFDFLTAYFSSDPCANANDSLAGPGAPNGISVQDIFDFLAAYFGGCE